MENVETIIEDLIADNLNKILEFNPYSKYDGVNNSKDFIKMISNDPAFAPFGLDTEKYVVGRVGGNLVTSIHRKIGDLYEEILLVLLEHTFDLSKEYLKYSLKLNIDGEEQKRTTDGRILIKDVTDPKLKKRLGDIVGDKYSGLALEVRSCYQIGDSKRIQADVHMATALQHKKVLPIMLIFCNSSLVSPVKRLKMIWQVYEGKETFDFIKHLTDYDLFATLMRHKKKSEMIMNKVFNMF